jgi:hypothetical protein
VRLDLADMLVDEHGRIDISGENPLSRLTDADGTQRIGRSWPP